MIVQPDFLDHWKTKALVTLTGDPAAPLMVLRLWGYCQSKRTSRFKALSDANLAGICHSKLPPAKIRATLLECGFIREDGDTTIVHDWETVNASLLASWRNGMRGGKPTSRITHGIPTGKPRATQANPRPLILSNTQEKNKEEAAVSKSDPTAVIGFGKQLSDLANKLRVNKGET
jgi:hypothetical protein